MAERPFILIVEDDDNHAELILRSLKGTADYEVIRTSSLAQARQVIGTGIPALVMADWKLNDGNGIALIEKDISEPRYPVVLMTACGDEAIAVEAIKTGALDYVVKSPESMTNMRHLAERAIREWQHLLMRRRAEASLHEHEAKLSSIFRAAPTGIGVVVRRHLIEVNDRFCEICGYSREELTGHSARMLYSSPEEYERVGREFYPEVQAHGRASIETLWRHKNGELINIFMIATFIEPGKEDSALTFIILDITGQVKEKREKELLEEKLRHARKLESVGRLAGGVAHDFNNLLTPIIGYSELLLKQLDAGDRQREAIMEIKLAAQRARDLTRQLLAFGRKQMLELKPVELGALIVNLEKLLKRTIRENIEIKITMCGTAFGVRADPGQLEQVVMNLVVNAQDAMPDGGRIVIELESRRFPDDEVAGVPAGTYVVMTVRDNGGGMSQEVIENLFEPFFTTKDIGKGTGLGLSTVYGIIRQHNGYIKVESSPGAGSSFRIYLPEYQFENGEKETAAEPDSTKTVMPEHPADNAAARGGVVLLVEDNDVVRQVTALMLEQAGFEVVAVASPQECLEMVSARRVDADLLLSDVIMPGINGRELYERLNAIRPDMKVLYMSGYPRNIILNQGGVAPETNFIQKPFSGEALLGKVRAVIRNQP